MTKTKVKPASAASAIPRWAVWTAAGILTVALVAGTLTYVYASVGQTLLKGTTIAGQNVGGLDSLTATRRLEQIWRRFSAAAFQFRLDDRTVMIAAGANTTMDDEVILGVASFEIQSSVDQAAAYGRRGSFWQRLRERTSAWFGRRHEFGAMSLNATVVDEQLRSRFADVEQAPKNAGMTVASDGRVTVTPSVNGITLNYRQAINRTARALRTLDTAPIALRRIVAPPDIVSAPPLQAIADRLVPLILERAPLTLRYGDQTWTLSPAQVKKLLGFVGNANSPVAGFDATTTTAYLQPVAKEIDVPSQNAKFSIDAGKVKEFQPSRVGTKLDIPATIAAMNDALITRGQSEAAVVTAAEQPLTNTVDTNALGITELVAEATTNFKGSPANRRYNLSYGAKILNGLIIQPNEEFSLVKALGPIDAAHGWKSELVIKGPKITPEFGGGLCQVGTTMFRVVLNAGLPILERRNHSLRIRYYEPPVGLDATIYDPKPDFRFRNDYAHPLLLQTKVEGNNLTFQFYGTKDGRTIDLPTPKVYNRTPIPATQTVEVDTLKPGERKCQEPGHPGADATATYTVTKVDGAKVTQVFKSHYRALPVICQVGKATKTKSSSAAKDSTSRPASTDTGDVVIVTD